MLYKDINSHLDECAETHTLSSSRTIQLSDSTLNSLSGKKNCPVSSCNFKYDRSEQCTKHLEAEHKSSEYEAISEYKFCHECGEVYIQKKTHERKCTKKLVDDSHSSDHNAEPHKDTPAHPGPTGFAHAYLFQPFSFSFHIFSFFTPLVFSSLLF
jgi:hypothetical protein